MGLKMRSKDWKTHMFIIITLIITIIIIILVVVVVVVIVVNEYEYMKVIYLNCR